MTVIEVILSSSLACLAITEFEPKCCCIIPRDFNDPQLFDLLQAYNIFNVWNFYSSVNLFNPILRYYFLAPADNRLKILSYLLFLNKSLILRLNKSLCLFCVDVRLR